MGRRPAALVLGASGMLGHQLLKTLQAGGYQVLGVQRSRAPRLDARDWTGFSRVLGQSGAEVVINCTGWVRQRPFEGHEAEAIHVNAAFPHLVSAFCRARGIGLVHISTDCVGDDDWYGLSKRLGEQIAYGMVLRTSFIGHELKRRRGLLEWVLGQTGSVKGYAGVLWNGLTTNELARVLCEIVLPSRTVHEGGLWQVAGPEITKAELLELVCEVYGHRLEIVRADEPAADRRLDGRAFDERFGYIPPSWREMLETMKAARPMLARRAA